MDMIRRHNCHSTSSDRNKTSESAFDMESESDLEKDLICNVEMKVVMMILKSIMFRGAAFDENFLF